MTVEQVNGCIADKKMVSVSEAVEELLKSAQKHHCLTVGVYESAKLMNIDPDSVLLCILAMDAEDEGDIALQIHFTLIQSFCYENNTDILRVSGLTRLEQLLPPSNANQPRDLHCLLVTSSQCQGEDTQQQALLQSISKYCEESRSQEQWVPYLALQQETSQDLSGKDTDDETDTDDEAECHNNNNNSGTFKAHVNEKTVPGTGLSVCMCMIVS